MVASKDKIMKWEVAHNNTNNFQFLFLAFKTHIPKLPSVVGVFACICIVYADIRKYRDSHHLPGDGTLRNAHLLFNEPFPLVSCIIAHAVVRGTVCFMLQEEGATAVETKQKQAAGVTRTLMCHEQACDHT